MTDALPAPFTPADCDVHDLPFMPFEVARFLASDLVALASAQEGWAAMLLWTRSWLQVPAASMTNDDRVLSRAANLSMAEWKKVREFALRGWVLCSDGRLYHRVVAEKANVAWFDRLRFRKRSALANRGRGRKTVDPTTFDDAMRDVAERTSKLNPTVGAGLEALLQGDDPPPSSTDPPSLKEPTRSEKASEDVRVRVRGKEEETAASASPLRPGGGSPLPKRWQDDPDFLRAWSALPDPMRRRSVSRDKTWPDWRRAAERADGADRLLRALARFLDHDPDVKRTGGPGFHLWLKDGSWEHWLDGADPLDAPDDDKWTTLVGLHRDGHGWSSRYGPEPGTPGCRVPVHILGRAAA